MQEVVQSFRKLGMPRDLAMILTIMVRFLFIFVDELRDIRQSMTSRNFDPFNDKISYKWRVKQVGYSIAMMFLKAYEKGETIYLSMASRCFSDNSNLYHAKTIIGKSEYIYLAIIVAIIILLELLVLFYSGNLASNFSILFFHCHKYLGIPKNLETFIYYKKQPIINNKFRHT